MTTLIHAQGAGAGRCDAKCYDARGAECDCVCGGMNHGMGAQGATQKTQDMGARMLDAVKERGGFVAPELLQNDLFADA